MIVTRFLLLIATFLVTATAVSETNLVFYADFGASGIKLNSFSVDGKTSVFSYAESEVEAANFTLFDSGLVYADNKTTPGYMGIMNGALAFGPDVAPVQFTFNDDKVITSPKTYLCPGPVGHTIVSIEETAGCNSLDIQLRPFVFYEPLDPSLEGQGFDADIPGFDETASVVYDYAETASVSKTESSVSKTESSVSMTKSSVSMASESSAPTMAAPTMTSESMTSESMTSVSMTSGSSMPVAPPSKSMSSMTITSSKCVDCRSSSASIKHDVTTITKNTTSTATICTECKAKSNVTVWKTYTDYVTYCPQETTFTVLNCVKVCHQSTVSVASATTLTITGVCVIPETITVIESTDKAVETPEISIEAPEVVIKGSKAEKSKEGSNAKSIKEGSNAKIIKEESNAKIFKEGSNAKIIKEEIKAEKSKAEKSKAEKESSRKTKAVDQTITQTRTRINTINTLSVSSFNGASKNAFGFCLLGFAALLL